MRGYLARKKIMQMGSLVRSKKVGEDHKSATDSGSDETESTTSSNGVDKGHNHTADWNLETMS